jgi:hypothetical protein
MDTIIDELKYNILFSIMDTIIDELKYNNIKVIVLKDSNNNIWFNAYNVCKILGYINPNDAIQKLVNKNHIKSLKKYYKQITNFKFGIIDANDLSFFKKLIYYQNKLNNSIKW